MGDPCCGLPPFTVQCHSTEEQRAQIRWWVACCPCIAQTSLLERRPSCTYSCFFILDTKILNSVLTSPTWLYTGGVQTRNVRFIASEPGLLDQQVAMHFGFLETAPPVFLWRRVTGARRRKHVMFLLSLSPGRRPHSLSFTCL